MNYMNQVDCVHEWFEGRCIHCEITPSEFKLARDVFTAKSVMSGKIVESLKNIEIALLEIKRCLEQISNEHRNH